MDSWSDIEREIKNCELKLLETRRECVEVEKKIFDASQLKEKGLFILRNVQRRNENLEEELKAIHCNYVNCVTKTHSCEEEDEATVKQIKELTVKRDNLKQEFMELIKTANRNSQKLDEIRSMIGAEEIRHISLLRKLKRRAEQKNITEDLRKKINEALRDPKITRSNVHDNIR